MNIVVNYQNSELWSKSKLQYFHLETIDLGTLNFGIHFMLIDIDLFLVMELYSLLLFLVPCLTFVNVN